MGIMLLKRISLLFLLISASFLSTSFAGRAGRRSKLASKSINVADAVFKEISRKPSHHYRRAEAIHERLLRANTRDYGNYDPAPALGKPPFKLIPN
ncbi:Protein casparian strip integrity factor 1 [Vitis vinifera]|uniref:Protein casparian strip integrity factor 1 n=1 Tax=Vitis vinifera TaxID=29760 RepID=A0A438EKY4_VITVI|nr:Protein casparian strip integrity factor 1 [Vitis vinifera]